MKPKDLAGLALGCAIILGTAGCRINSDIERYADDFWRGFNYLPAPVIASHNKTRYISKDTTPRKKYENE